MNNSKVAILLSTYNGEKYLKEQLDSLINQTYKNIDIIIRDDGSKDNTVKIIKEYQEKYDNIFLDEGKNIGFIKSFFELLKSTKNADIYSYCDQDDVWEIDKIERAVDFIEKEKSNVPILYFSNSDYYDANMVFLGHAPKDKVYNFRNSLVECVTQGMTMCINKNMRDTIVKDIPQNTTFHDWWTYMIASGFGKIIYDDKSEVRYRRHNKSVTVEGRGFLEFQIWRIKKFFLGDSLKQIKKQIIEYSNLYREKLNKEDKKILDLFNKPKYNFLIALKKTFYLKRFRRKLTDEIMLRILFLFGKL